MAPNSPAYKFLPMLTGRVVYHEVVICCQESPYIKKFPKFQVTVGILTVVLTNIFFSQLEDKYINLGHPHLSRKPRTESV